MNLLEQLAHEIPVAAVTYTVPNKVGLIIVDEVNGFCTVGAGNLAPTAPNAQISRMVDETATLAKKFLDRNNPVFVFRDTHVPGRAEPPYPPHCEAGTGEEELVPELKFLENTKGVTLYNKDCINGFVGAMELNFSHSSTNIQNALVDWINDNELEAVIVCGICISICDLDLVVSLMSARNHYFTTEHKMLRSLKDVVVFEQGTADYDLPRSVVDNLGLPATAAHPQDLVSHIGLYVMQSRGAIIANELKGL